MGFFQIWPCDLPRKNSSTFSLYCTTQHILIQGCCTTLSGGCEKCLFAPDSAWQIKDWFCISLGEPMSLLDWLPGAWVTQNSCIIENAIIRMYNDTADAAHGVPPSANLLSVVYISQEHGLLRGGWPGEEERLEFHVTVLGLSLLFLTKDFNHLIAQAITIVFYFFVAMTTDHGYLYFRMAKDYMAMLCPEEKVMLLQRECGMTQS